MNASDAPVTRTTADLAIAFRLEVIQAGEVEVTGVSLDNRQVRPGDLFAALPGARTHGADHAVAAVEAGAVAILTDAAGAQRLSLAGSSVPVLVAPDIRAVLGDVSAAVYGEPARRLRSFGITGTNGKTTTTYLLEQILDRLGRTTGLIGTVELKVAGEQTPARLTTPEAPQLQALLAQMVTAGVTDLVMEVSSHALALHRVDAIVYDMVGFTHLTADHLDFHGGMEEYYRTKASLFTPARARRGVILADDSWGRRLAAEAEIPVVTIGTQTPPTRPDPDTDWLLTIVAARPDHTTFTVTHRDGRSLSTEVWMPGRFNVTNAAMAVVMALESGISIGDLHRVLGHHGLRGNVPGRMERVADHPRCIVDFAHNTEALNLALKALRPTTKGRLFVVFGATGERDTAKRPLMGEVAVAGADVVVITDDDPHDEDAAQIRSEVMVGAVRALPAAQRAGRTVDVFEVAPRAKAIRRAVQFAGPADTVLIAGRGHETIQEIAGVEHHLDDREEVRAALAEGSVR
ncbi:UDP-N-acetylmuramoyl-L-alanyl-D-glutamate--2,6-diaminopimelate ligase [Ruania halotolerans]|uniref:UDP-N-acetylmuramoyl-L-alanyl-D-glutamate--2, 6-diaminopimelate ligase n=1 Tax=Ruania halotolerans TaxID=2897773 RepID=UPI001E34C661|nr:UDP-N-acetylmuramoyl-L-alanyl-D-glutamate--2,6-diaminopimelate ligase [Ruania halotolerans]UFU05126.1 UDP-N-acetylmuramoyl-L-alanyl-D-glutamate--2,6-diaminopimelate ligase [Ruania halotolerans]